jgi:hypothetical protein
MNRDPIGEHVEPFVSRVAGDYRATTALSDIALGGVLGVRVAAIDTRSPETEPADLVVSLGAASGAIGWEEHLVSLGRLARKALVVVVPNPERLGLRHGARGPRVTDLARVLWRIGRVRERAYLDVPRLVAAGHRGAMHVPVGPLVRRTAGMQAFVVDTAPRTPQARLRLRTVGTGDRRAE